jgi:hypothetical protein
MKFQSLELKKSEMERGELDTNHISTNSALTTPISKGNKRIKQQSHPAAQVLTPTPATASSVRKKGVDRISKRTRVSQEDLD